MAGSKRACAGIISIVIFIAVGLVVFQSEDAEARYKPRPKKHFLSWESLRRPEDYKRMEQYIKSHRRFDLRRERVVRLKKSSFWNTRPYQFSTPILEGDRMYVGADAGYFYGINIKLKEKNWTFKTEGAVQTEGSADGEAVFFGDCKSNFYALDVKYGKLLWQTKLDTSIMAKPLITGDKIYVVSMSGRLFAIDRQSGVEVWHTDANERSFGFSVRRSGEPVMQDGLIYVGTSSGLLLAYNAEDGTMAWARQIGDRRSQLYDVDSKPLFLDGRMFVTSADGTLTCLDPRNGKIIWEIFAGGSNDPLYHEEKLYVTGGNTLTCLNPQNGRIYWQQEFDDPGLSSPAGGRNFVTLASTTNRLYLIDSDTGDIMHERYIRKGSFGDPVVVGDMLYVLSNSGRVFTFRVKELKPRARYRRLAEKSAALE